MAKRKKCQLPAHGGICGEPAAGEIAGIPFCVQHYDLFMEARDRLKREYGEKEADETIECVIKDVVGEDEEWYDWPEDDEDEAEE